MYAAVLKSVESELDDGHVADDTLELWDELDTRALGQSNAEDVPPEDRHPSGAMSAHLRQEVLKQLFVVDRELNAPSTCWFQAARLFDFATADLGLGAQTPTSHVIVRAAAAWLLCFKSESLNKRYWGPVLDTLVATMSALSVRSCGLRLSKDAVLAEERYLLAHYPAALGLPNVMRWFQAMSTRFSIVTRGSYEDQLSHHQTRVLQLMVHCTLKAPPSPGNPPKYQAAAAATLMLMIAGVLPPSEISRSLQLDKIARLSPRRGADDPDSPRGRIGRAALEFATSMSKAALEQCLTVFLE